jgi:heme A synthase
LCNGEVVVRPQSIETLVELSHRLTSGLALVSVVVMFVWARRVSEPGAPVRLGAGLSLGFMLAEAALGAGLVLFGLVADDASGARAFAVAAHLLNTFLLLAALTVTVYWASGGPRLTSGGRSGSGRLALGAVALLAVSVAGAITALGDTLFPSVSLAEGLRADLSATSHVLIRLRTVHPVLAIAVAVYLITSARRLAGNGTHAALLARVLTWLLAVQLLAGGVNVALLAPVWLQLVHLLLADAVWVTYVFLAAEAMAASPAAAEGAQRRTPISAAPTSA